MPLPADLLYAGNKDNLSTAWLEHANSQAQPLLGTALKAPAWHGRMHYMHGVHCQASARLQAGS